MRAFLIIDMLKDFVKEEAPLEVPEARNMITNLKELLGKERKRDSLIIYVNDRHRRNDSEFKEYPQHAIKETEGAEVIEALSPEPSDLIIEKRRFSAFYGTELDLTLRENNVNQLIVTGILTNICVLYTVADARMRGYEVKVPKDCVASDDKAAHEFALNQIKNVLGAEIT